MIIDASVAFKWVFVEEGSDRAAALIGRADLLAPDLLLAEVANGIWKKIRRRELRADADVATQLGLVASLIITQPEAELIERALQIAIELEHAIYDCIYLAMAEQGGTELITADNGFRRKVEASALRVPVRAL